MVSVVMANMILLNPSTPSISYYSGHFADSYKYVERHRWRNFYTQTLITSLSWNKKKNQNAGTVSPLLLPFCFHLGSPDSRAPSQYFMQRACVDFINERSLKDLTFILFHLHEDSSILQRIILSCRSFTIITEQHEWMREMFQQIYNKTNWLINSSATPRDTVGPAVNAELEVGMCYLLAVLAA